ncbi:hypothetical protein ACVILK_005296 [Bradyrhizobium embrapense]
MPPLAINAHTMRAVLLAKATITSMGGLRSSIRERQGSVIDPFRMAQRTVALAPMISGRRNVRSAHPRCLPELLPAARGALQRREAEPCRKIATSLEGLSRWRQRGKCCSGDRSYTGNGHQARSSASSRARRAISRSSTATLASSDRSCSTSRNRIGRAASGIVESFSIAATSLVTWKSPCATTSPNSARCPRIALMIWVRWRTTRSRTRNTMAAACCSSLFTATNRMVGRWAASEIASASAASFVRGRPPHQLRHPQDTQDQSVPCSSAALSCPLHADFCLPNQSGRAPVR